MMGEAAPRCGADFLCMDIDEKEAVRKITPNEIQRRHRQEREAVVDEALQSSSHHLVRAHSHFESAIQDPNARYAFIKAIERAHEVLADIDGEPATG